MYGGELKTDFFFSKRKRAIAIVLQECNLENFLSSPKFSVFIQTFIILECHDKRQS